MWLRKFFGLALISSFLSACGDDGIGSGGSGGTTSQGGGGAGLCSTPADCPAPAAECQVATCSNGACGTTIAPEGTEVGAQTACQKIVCQAGAPAAQLLAEGTACAEKGGNVCDGAGECVECIVNADCKEGAKPLCTARHTCIPIDCINAIQDGNETDIDCGGLCDPCDTAKTCLEDSDCYHGKCDAGACAAPACDDGVANGGDYLEDNGETDVDCGGPCPTKCGPTMGCDVAADCVGAECTGPNGTCVPNCLDQVKNNAETDADCGGGTCAACAIGQQCGAADSNCMVGAYCGSGTCTAKKAPGVMCGGTNECLAGVCDANDGVCCDKMCGDNCQSCKLAGTEGTCLYVPQGQDPENECPGVQVCDGDKLCVKQIGETCAVDIDCLSGNCIDGLCCNAGCGGTCQACNLAGSEGTCMNIPVGQDPDNECANGACTGSASCQKAPGDTCSSNVQCGSGFCTDGRCCDTACNGLCAACNLTGSLGTCTNVPAGTDPAGECGGVTPNCNGNGMCGP